VIHLFGVSNANSVYRTGVAEDVCSRTTLPNALITPQQNHFYLTSEVHGGRRSIPKLYSQIAEIS